MLDICTTGRISYKYQVRCVVQINKRRQLSMFKNLKVEMLRQDVTTQQIADVLNIKLDTARLKINGKIGISMDDCHKVAMLFKEKNDIDYLFKRYDKPKQNKN